MVLSIFIGKCFLYFLIRWFGLVGGWRNYCLVWNVGGIDKWLWFKSNVLFFIVSLLCEIICYEYCLWMVFVVLKVDWYVMIVELFLVEKFDLVGNVVV